jgi:hypothetical protein
MYLSRFVQWYYFQVDITVGTVPLKPIDYTEIKYINYFTIYFNKEIIYLYLPVIIWEIHCEC